MKMKVLSRLILLLAFAVPAAAGDYADVLPDASIHLKAARYDPVEADLHWTGWLGAGAGLVRIGAVVLDFNADVETILGNTYRAFDADQVNYHLQPGLRWRRGATEMGMFFHHVSRHYVDRAKSRAVDWNTLGVRAAGPLPVSAPFPGHFAIGVGHTTEAALVRYGWEATARLDADVLRRRWGSVYLRTDLRAVSATPSPELPRGSFLDRAIEAGVRWEREQRFLSLFAAWEHRNDVFLEASGARNRGLFGFRIGYATFVPAAPR
jgi:hypothetical protein